MKEDFLAGDAKGRIVIKKERFATLQLAIAGMDIAIDTRGVGPADHESLSRQWDRCLSSRAESERPSTEHQGAEAECPPSVRIRNLSSRPPAGTAAPLDQWIPVDCFEELAALATSYVTLTLIQHLTGVPLMFHAAAVSDHQGRVAGLIASSGTGKTTAAALLGQSMDYVTDETLIVREDLSVQPYAKPLSVIRGPGRPKVQVGPDDLDLGCPTGDLYLHRLALLCREPQASEPHLRFPETLDGLTRAIPEISALPQTKRPFERLTHLLEHTGPFVELVYREAEELPGLISEMMSLPPRETGIVRATNAVSTPWPPGTSAVPTEVDQIQGCRRLPAWDAVTDGDRLLLMCGSNVALLDGMGIDLWEEAETALSVDTAVSMLEHRYGEHPHSAQLVRGQMASMAQAGVMSTW